MTGFVKLVYSVTLVQSSHRLIPTTDGRHLPVSQSNQKSGGWRGGPDVMTKTGSISIIINGGWMKDQTNGSWMFDHITSPRPQRD